MYKILKGLRIIEGASFIAAPSCGLYLSQLGAEVIRFDMVGGGPDYRRWPLSSEGSSFYWEGLNKGKKSIAIDLTKPQGRELAVDLICAPGPDRGIFLTNFPAGGFLAYDKLAAKRSDVIVVRVMGRPDGGNAVDYTVNCAVGIPYMTGPPSLGDEPVNHALPAWDLTTGAYAGFSLLAAERQRRLEGLGQEIRIPLSDVAMATLSHLGQVAEVSTSGADRPRIGNDLFGAFGRDFVTADGQRIMIAAITARQWTGLVEALALEAPVAALETKLGISFGDEGARFVHRGELNLLVGQALRARSLADLSPVFDRCGVCWGPYRTLRQALAEDRDFCEANPMFSMLDHPSGKRYLTAGSAAAFTGNTRETPRPAPRLGEHTDEILSGFLGLSERAITDLHERGLVAGPRGEAR